MDSVLHLLGIARKAGRLEVGEEPVGGAARSRQAKLIVVASDAAENSVRRAARFAQGGKSAWVRVPYAKGELGAAVGRSACAMLALTDAGLASALAEKLAAGDPLTFGPAAEALAVEARRTLQRQKEKRAHEKKLQRGRRKPWAAPPPESPEARKKRSRPPDGKSTAQAARPSGHRDRQEENAMRRNERTRLAPMRKPSGETPAEFSNWCKPASGGGLFAE